MATPENVLVSEFYNIVYQFLENQKFGKFYGTLWCNEDCTSDNN